MYKLSNFYKTFNTKFSKFADKTTLRVDFTGIKLLAALTPGRHIYYYGENELTLDDKFKWEIRMPNKYAGSVPTTKYQKSVEKAMQDYLDNVVKYNYNGLSLDLTVDDVIKAHKLHEAYERQVNDGTYESSWLKHNLVVEDILTYRNLTILDINNLYEKATNTENLIVDEMNAAGITGASHTDNEVGIAGIQGSGAYLAILKHLKTNPNDSTALNLRSRLAEVAHIRAELALLEFDLYLTYVAKYLSTAEEREAVHEMQEFVNLALAYYQLFPEATLSTNSEVEAIRNNSASFVLSLELHLSLHLNECALDKSLFKSDEEASKLFYDSMYHYLATHVVVPDHKKRYQEEQFERFQATRNLPLNGDATLRQVCHEYSETIRFLVEKSHNFKSPKIDANYEEFLDKSVNLIFYYFFSVSKFLRYLANVLLSAARYPNEKIRRAYIRYFNASI